MDPETIATPKRSASPLDSSELPDAKKTKTTDTPPITPKSASPEKSADATPAEQETPTVEVDDLVTAIESFSITKHHETRCAIQRSIALVLKHVGFESSKPDAMESFTALVETYLESMIEETTRFANASRRDDPIPTDFEAMLRYHNLPIASLKPHLRNPIPQSQLAPAWDTSVLPEDPDAVTTLPLLSEELSGKADKDAMHHIPSNFPAFPSRHTYRFTPQEDKSARDSQKIREEAARTAQQGEDALRRLVRASKMRKQKEVKTLVERDHQGKERFRLWEATMRRFMGPTAAADRNINPNATDNSVTGQVDIADHSMIVNSDAMFARKEISRFGKRAAASNAAIKPAVATGK